MAFLLRCVRARASRGCLVLCCCILASLAAPAFALNPDREINQYSIASWQREHGLPMNTLWRVAIGGDGFVWIGTEEGLVRFDGSHFKLFLQSPITGLPSSNIQAIERAGDGTLWLGTYGAGVVRWDGSRVVASYTMRDGLSSNQITAIAEAPDGLWIGTPSGLNRIEGGTIKTFTRADGLPIVGVSALRVTRDGTLWAGTGAEIVSIRDRRVTVTDAPTRPREEIHTIEDGADGAVWFGSADGLYEYRNGVFTRYTTADGLASNFVRSLHRDHHGSLWVGTSSGLTLLRDGRFSSLTVADGIQVDDLLDLSERPDGSLWLVTLRSGLINLSDGLFTRFTTRQGMSSDTVNCVAGRAGGGLWIGTADGKVDAFHEGRFQPLAIGELGGKEVKALLEDRTGNLWIGTSLGLYRYRERELARLITNPVRTIMQDRAGAIWVGTDGGGVHVLHADEKTTVFRMSDGLAGDQIRGLLEDRTGAIWIAAYGGLSRLQHGKLATYRMADGLPSDLVRTLYEDRDGTLWIGTYGGGLARYRGGVFHAFTSRDGMTSDIIYNILDDERGSLWLTYSKGVYRVSKRELEDFAAGRATTIDAVSYGKRDGVGNGESLGNSPAGWRAGDGRMWFPTVQGLAVVDPSRAGGDVVAPAIYIDGMAADGRSIARSDPVLPPGTQRFEVRFGAQAFDSPIKLSYMLEGYDVDWVDAGDERIAVYTGIPPGTYQFRLRGITRDGASVPGPTIASIHMRPRFYQTWWFAVACVLSVVAIALFGYRLRVRRLHQQQVELELVVSRRTAELAQANAELDRERRELEASLGTIRETQAQLFQASKMAAVGQLAAGVSHEINNPLAVILGFAQGMERHLDTTTEKLMVPITSIAREAVRCKKLVQALLTFSRTGSSSMELVDVAATLDSTYCLLQPRARTQDTRLILDLEPHVPRILANKTQLEQIVINLGNNGLDALVSGGELTLRLRRRDDRVVIEVHDTGPGIPDDVRPRIFEPFFTTKEVGKGTGLGLSLVYEIVQQHRGTIEVDSQPGDGTMLRVQFAAATTDRLL